MLIVVISSSFPSAGLKTICSIMLPQILPTSSGCASNPNACISVLNSDNASTENVLCNTVDWDYNIKIDSSSILSHPPIYIVLE